VLPVDRTSGGSEDDLGPVATSRLEDLDRPEDVDLAVVGRPIDRDPHVGLGSEVEADVRFGRFECGAHVVLRADVADDEIGTSVDVPLPTGREVVEGDDLVTAVEERVDDVRADEPGASCNYDSHEAQSYACARIRRMLRLCGLALFAVLAAAAVGLSAPQASGAALPYAPGAHDVVFKKPLAADSYIAIDAEAGKVLIAHRDRVPRPIASLTKMMTALLVIESGKVSGKARVPKIATTLEPSNDGLRRGRWYSRWLLLYSALLASNNDAAATLAHDQAGGSLEAFYERMTARARELGMDDTIYRSSSGLNDDTNLSTAYDQAILSRAALGNEVFAQIVATREKSFPWPPPTHGKVYVNHNKLLFWDAGAYGIKTGFTERAGGCVAAAVRRDGRSVIAIILDSDSIWSDMPRLVNRAFRLLKSE
jgi:D-alanyl-D-alanine carboxypeptidase